jgi:hypothetical protein
MLLKNMPTVNNPKLSKGLDNQKLVAVGKAPSDRISAKSLSDNFYSHHNRTLAMQSFQILSQFYHPNFLAGGKESAPGDYLLILEQQYKPAYQASLRDAGKRPEKPVTSVLLSEYRNFKIQNDFGAIHEDEDIEEEDKEVDLRSQQNNVERPEGRISCTFRSLAQHFRSQIGLGANSEGEMGSSDKGTVRSNDKSMIGSKVGASP